MKIPLDENGLLKKFKKDENDDHTLTQLVNRILSVFAQFHIHNFIYYCLFFSNLSSNIIYNLISFNIIVAFYFIVVIFRSIYIKSVFVFDYTNVISIFLLWLYVL